MSKADGQKIAIQFTKDLTGDITGNESAFKISGVEYDYVPNGNLVGKEYQIGSVDRYPVLTLYADNFTGSTDGVKIINDAAVLETIEGEPVETNIWDGTYTTQFLSGGKWQAQSGGTRTTTKISTVAGATYNFLGGNRCRLLWVDSSGGTVSWEDCANDVPITRSAPANATGVYYYYTNSSQTDATVTTMVPSSEYSVVGSYTPTPISSPSLPAGPRIKLETDIPTGTSITAEYGVTNSNSTPPSVWETIEDADILTNSQTEGDFLWLKFTFETTDTDITPSLERAWLEEASAPQNILLITTVGTSRFCSAVGNLTVSYDASVGNLAGLGGPVDSFNVTFSPEDLISKPHQNPQEHLEISDISAEGNLIRIYYSDVQDGGEHLEITNISAVGILTHIDDI